jgi:hypothetical protein
MNPLSLNTLDLCSICLDPTSPQTPLIRQTNCCAKDFHSYCAFDLASNDISSCPMCRRKPLVFKLNNKNIPRTVVRTHSTSLSSFSPTEYENEEENSGAGLVYRTDAYQPLVKAKLLTTWVREENCTMLDHYLRQEGVIDRYLMFVGERGERTPYNLLSYALRQKRDKVAILLIRRGIRISRNNIVEIANNDSHIVAKALIKSDKKNLLTPLITQACERKAEKILLWLTKAGLIRKKHADSELFSIACHNGLINFACTLLELGSMEPNNALQLSCKEKTFSIFSYILTQYFEGDIEKVSFDVWKHAVTLRAPTLLLTLVDLNPQGTLAAKLRKWPEINLARNLIFWIDDTAAIRIPLAVFKLLIDTEVDFTTLPLIGHYLRRMARLRPKPADQKVINLLLSQASSIRKADFAFVRDRQEEGPENEAEAPWTRAELRIWRDVTRSLVAQREASRGCCC